MKYLLIIFYLITYSLNAQKKTNSFEGIITYKVQLTLKDNNLPEQSKQYLEQKFGDTIRVFHHHDGSILKKYLGSGLKGNDYQLYNSKNNYYYLKNKYSDTIYFQNVSHNPLELKNKKINDRYEIIMGQKCNSITYVGYSNQREQEISITFHYSGKPYVNPKFYKEWKDFFNSDFFRTSKSPYLKYILDTNYFTLEVTAVNMQKTKIEEKIFKLPKNSILLDIGNQ